MKLTASGDTVGTAPGSGVVPSADTVHGIVLGAGNKLSHNERCWLIDGGSP